MNFGALSCWAKKNERNQMELDILHVLHIFLSFTFWMNNAIFLNFSIFFFAICFLLSVNSLELKFFFSFFHFQNGNRKENFQRKLFCCQGKESKSTKGETSKILIEVRGVYLIELSMASISRNEMKKIPLELQFQSIQY